MDSIQVPEIDTARLTMRGHHLEDFADSAAMWGDPEVTRHLGGRPFTEEEVWSRLLRYVGLWPLLGYGYWVVRDRASGRFVGEVGFADLKRAIDPPFGDALELGWALAPWGHGRGLATEAVGAAIDWAAARFGDRRIVCLVGPENAASIRVAEKCGFRRFARSTYRGEPTVLFERRLA